MGFVDWWTPHQSSSELAMKKTNRNFEIFSLSFLDVMSCGFGAIVLLVLISNNAEEISPSLEEEAKAMLETVLVAEEKVSELNTRLAESEKKLSFEQELTRKTIGRVAKEKAVLALREIEIKKQQADLEGLELVRSSIKSASITPSTAHKRDDEVGGIPVDSDYIIFIVDTSGSMKEIWNRVTEEVLNVLKIHPRVKGFQVLNDNGSHLISGYSGKWIPDTPKRRKSIFKVFGAWNSMSNSSPVEGLEVALRKYAKPNISLSIYIFGDDYSGASYDRVIDALVKLNTNRITGKRLAKVHAVGFISKYSTNRFSILMREVTKRNGGTFIALPE
jgi:hypothetical protein